MNIIKNYNDNFFLVPRQSPLFTLLTVSETYILINVSNLHANQSCGEIDFNIIFFKNFTCKYINNCLIILLVIFVISNFEFFNIKILQD